MQSVNIATTRGAVRSKKPTKIVIHAMGEYITTPDQDYTAVEYLNHLRLSCHYMVTPSGVVINCANPDNRTTWHAKGHNSSSIGIEILVPGVHYYGSFLAKIKTDWCKKDQFDASIELVKGLITKYNGLGVARHSDLDPDRKQDPGDGFKWDQFMLEVLA